MTAPKPPVVPVQKNPENSDDGLLDSLGKAIADPVKTGAEDEERSQDDERTAPPGNGRR